MTNIMNTIIMIAEKHSPSLLHPELNQESTTPGEQLYISVDRQLPNLQLQ